MDYYIAIITEDTDFFSMEKYGEQPALPESGAAGHDAHFLAVELFKSYAEVEAAHKDGATNHIVIVDCDLSYLKDLNHTEDPSGQMGLTMTLLNLSETMMETMHDTLLVTCGNGERQDGGVLDEYVPHLDKADGPASVMAQISEIIDEYTQEAPQAAPPADDFDPSFS